MIAIKTKLSPPPINSEIVSNNKGTVEFYRYLLDLQKTISVLEEKVKIFENNGISPFQKPILSYGVPVIGGVITVFTISNYNVDFTYIVTGDNGTGEIIDDIITWTFTDELIDRNQELLVTSTLIGYVDSPTLVEVVEVSTIIV